MRTTLIHFLLTIICYQSLAQDSIDFEFLESRARRVQPYGMVYYSDYTMKNYHEIFKRDFRRTLIGINGDTLTFSRAEEEYLDRELRKRVKERLPDNLFSNSFRKARDSIVPLVETLNQSYMDSIGKMPSRVPGFIPMRYWAFSFSRPIYIKQGQWMIFYLMYYENSSGNESLGIYKRSLSGWTFWGYIGGGAW